MQRNATRNNHAVHYLLVLNEEWAVSMVVSITGSYTVIIWVPPNGFRITHTPIAKDPSLENT